MKEKTVSELFELIYLAMDFERDAKNYGTDISISSAEIHQLKCINDIPKANITLLANAFDVSKSAISQSVKKLKLKGLVDIKTDDENQSRYIISLTDTGKKAHEEHISLHTNINSKLVKLLEDIPENTCEEIFSFISKSKDILKKFV